MSFLLGVSRLLFLFISKYLVLFKMSSFFFGSLFILFTEPAPMWGRRSAWSPLWWWPCSIICWDWLESGYLKEDYWKLLASWRWQKKWQTAKLRNAPRDVAGKIWARRAQCTSWGIYERYDGARQWSEKLGALTPHLYTSSENGFWVICAMLIEWRLYWTGRGSDEPIDWRRPLVKTGNEPTIGVTVISASRQQFRDPNAWSLGQKFGWGYGGEGCEHDLRFYPMSALNQSINQSINQAAHKFAGRIAGAAISLNRLHVWIVWASDKLRAFSCDLNRGIVRLFRISSGSRLYVDCLWSSSKSTTLKTDPIQSVLQIGFPFGFQ